MPVDEFLATFATNEDGLSSDISGETTENASRIVSYIANTITTYYGEDDDSPDRIRRAAEPIKATSIYATEAKRAQIVSAVEFTRSYSVWCVVPGTHGGLWA